jgi:hypothetical protein
MNKIWQRFDEEEKTPSITDSLTVNMDPNVFNCVITSKIRSLKSVHMNVVGWELMVIVDKEDFNSDDGDMVVLLLWR